MPDLTRLRDDLGYFAAQAGAPLTRWQSASVDLSPRITVIVAGRQLGKSYTLAVLALWWAYRSPGQRVLIISAGEGGSRRLLAEIRRIAVGSPLLAGSVVDEQSQLLTLTNGSEIRSVPASERQIRGWAVDLLLIDEAGSPTSDLILSAALPTTAARPHARIVMADSAWSTDGAFYDHARAGESGSDHVRTHKWVAKSAGGAEDAPWVTASTIAAARESLGELRFRAEYLGEFASGADAVFTRRALERATVDMPLVTVGELGGGVFLGGIDWGESRDRSALVAVGRIQAAGPPIFGVAAAHRWQSGHPLPDVIDEVVTFAPAFDSIVAERNGLGAPCCQQLARRLGERNLRVQRGMRPGYKPLWCEVLPEDDTISQFGTVTTTADMKAHVFGALRMLLERGQLVIPTGAIDLLRELMMLRVDLTAGGNERIEASVGHDDLAMALALAMHPVRAENSRTWRTWVGDLAEADLLPAADDESRRDALARPVWTPVREHDRPRRWPPRDIEDELIRRARQLARNPERKAA